MNKKRLNALQTSSLRAQISRYPESMFSDLLKTAANTGQTVYVTGGAMRDWLLGQAPNDLDFTIGYGALDFIKQFREVSGKGTVVPLGIRHDDTCRIVVDELVIDVSGLRRGSMSLEEDLGKRDFTVNAIAADVADIVGDGWDIPVIDPMNGLEDMQRKILRACPGAFSDDPLRMVRAFRFSACLGYSIDADTRASIAARVNLINMSAVERVSYECDRIMESTRAYEAVVDMDEVGLLPWIAAELYEGDGVEQPEFHHLDVLRHNMFSLDCMQRLIAAPERYFSMGLEAVRKYIENSNSVILLKWAALFHDVGKPATRKVVPEKNDRITFYGHDQEGARKFLEFCERMKWNKKNRERAALLIEMHMHPFHLCNVLREDGTLSSRAKLKLCRKAGDELPGLFMLAMADSLAGQGADKPEGMEQQVADLFGELEEMFRNSIEPVLKGPKLLTGHDLIDTLGLTPGPEFREILAALDLAVIEKDVQNREDALRWVQAYLKNNGVRFEKG